MTERVTQENPQGIASKLLYRSTCFFGGLALGALLGSSSQNYEHAQNALVTALVPLISFPLIDKVIGNRNNHDIVERVMYITPGFIAGQYFRQTINQML